MRFQNASPSTICRPLCYDDSPSLPGCPSCLSLFIITIAICLHLLPPRLCLSVCVYTLLYVCVFILSAISILRSLKSEVYLIFLLPSKHLSQNIHVQIIKAPFSFKYKLIFPYKAVICIVLEYPHSNAPCLARGVDDVVRREEQLGARRG